MTVEGSHLAPSSRPWAGIRTRRRKPCAGRPAKTYPRPLGRPHNLPQSRTHGRRTSWVRWCGEMSGWQELYPSAGAIVSDPQRGPSRPRGKGDVDGSPHGSDILALRRDGAVFAASPEAHVVAARTVPASRLLHTSETLHKQAGGGRSGGCPAACPGGDPGAGARAPRRSRSTKNARTRSVPRRLIRGVKIPARRCAPFEKGLE